MMIMDARRSLGPAGAKSRPELRAEGWPGAQPPAAPSIISALIYHPIAAGLAPVSLASCELRVQVRRLVSRPGELRAGRELRVGR